MSTDTSSVFKVFIDSGTDHDRLQACVDSLIEAGFHSGNIYVISGSGKNLAIKQNDINVITSPERSIPGLLHTIANESSGRYFLYLQGSIRLVAGSREKFEQILSERPGLTGTVECAYGFDPEIDMQNASDSGTAAGVVCLKPDVFAFSAEVIERVDQIEGLSGMHAWLLYVCRMARKSGLHVTVSTAVTTRGCSQIDVWQRELITESTGLADQLRLLRKHKDFQYSFREMFGLEEADALLDPAIPQYSVILVNTEAGNHVHVCLERLKRYTPVDRCEIFLTGYPDDDMLDAGTEWLKVEYIPPVPGETDTTTVNRAIAKVKGANVLLLFDSCFVFDDTLNELSEVLAWNGNLAAVGPKASRAQGLQAEDDAAYDSLGQGEAFNKQRKSGKKRTAVFVQMLEGFCILFRKRAFKHFGLFDDDFHLSECCFDDFFSRFHDIPDRIAVAERAFVHNEGIYSLQELDSPDKKQFERKWNADPVDERKRAKHAYFRAKLAGTSAGTGNQGADEAAAEEIRMFLERANECIRNNAFEEGMALYDQVLLLNPTQLETLHNKAMVQYQSGRRDEALAGLQRIIDTEPEFASAYNSLGLIWFSEGRFEKAYSYFKKAISYDIEFEQAYENLRMAAEKFDKPLVSDTDIVLYTGGIPFDGNTIYEKGLGGSESALFYMAREFARMGFTVKVFNNCENPGKYEGVTYGDFTDFYIYSRFNKIKVLISSRSFKPFFSSIDAAVNIVWLHDTFDVFYLQGYDFTKLDFSTLRFFVLSEFHKNEWKRNLPIPEENFYITRNGINPDYFESAGWERKKYKLIYSSRPSRGLGVLLDIFPEIRKRIPDAELHVFGYTLSDKDDELIPYLQKAGQPGVILRGSVSQQDLAREMTEAYVLVYPSTFKETSCITAIEAQAAGLPVVTSALAALKETVADGISGIVIEGDATSKEYQTRFIEEVERICSSDEVFQKYSNGGKDRATRLYRWNIIAEEWIGKISALCREKGIEFKAVLPDRAGEPAVTVSLCMIAKNEEKLLPECLESVKDFVNEIIVIDTGSTDGTAEIARSYGAKVYDFQWRDDFSAARNESLKHASGDWILYLDADERISPENGRKIPEIIADKSVDAVNLVETIPQQDGNFIRKYKSDYTRLFRRTETLKFTGRVHEQILPSIQQAGGKVIKSDIEIEHFGFSDSAEKKNARRERNLKLLLEERKDSPADPFIYYNLGLTYKEMENYDKAVEAFRKCLDLNETDPLKPELIAHVYIALSQLYFTRDEKDKAALAAHESLKHDPDQALPEYILAGIAFEQQDFITAGKHLQNIVAKYRARKEIAEEIDMGQVWLDLGNSWYRLQEFQEAVAAYAEAVKFNPQSVEALFNMGNAAFMIKDLDRAEDAYRIALAVNPSLTPAEENLAKVRQLKNQ